jgi:hypothetical protein
VRKTLRQRRREAKEALRKQNDAALDEASDSKDEPATEAAEAKAKPAKVTDTAGPAEAMSTTDGVGVVKPPLKKQAAQARKPVLPETPATGTPVVGTPVAGTPVAGTPVAGTPVAGTPVAGTPAAKVPPQPKPVARPRPSEGQAPPPRQRSRPQTPRPTGPVPGAPVTPSRQRLAGPRPNRPASEPTGTPNRPTNWAWPGGPRQRDQRDQRTGKVVPERPSEPLGERIKRAAAPLVDRVKGLTRRPEPESDDATLIEKVSARDAIAAVRRGRGRPARRPRFPSFGRSKPAPPPSSRQLPAGSSKRPDDAD